MSRAKPYPSDVTDAEWELIEPLLPQRREGDGRGAPRQRERREILNAIFYQNRTGCQWEALPRDFPPKGTVYDYFRQWRKTGTLARIHDALREQVRRQAGREVQPSAAVVDSQSAKSTEKGGSLAR